MQMLCKIPVLSQLDADVASRMDDLAAQAYPDSEPQLLKHTQTEGIADAWEHCLPSKGSRGMHMKHHIPNLNKVSKLRSDLLAQAA